MTEWRAVPGWDGFYEISSGGAVRSLDRPRVAPGRRPFTGKELRQVIRQGYATVMLKRGERQQMIGIHRTIMLVFRPHPDAQRLDVCHNNGVRTDNRLCNLRWDTRKGNLSDMAKHGTRLIGERAPGARLTDEWVRAIRSSPNCITTADLSRQFGVSYTAVELARKRRTWKHIK